MKICSNCGNHVTDNTLFCGECGSKLSSLSNTDTPQVSDTNMDSPHSSPQNYSKNLIFGILLTIGVFIFYTRIAEKYDFRINEFKTYFFNGLAGFLNLIGVVVLFPTISKQYRYRIIGIITVLIGVFLVLLYWIGGAIDLFHLIFD